jgi:hypothetical protein
MINKIENLFEGCPISLIKLSENVFVYLVTIVPTQIIKELKYALNFIDADKLS